MSLAQATPRMQPPSLPETLLILSHKRVSDFAAAVFAIDPGPEQSGWSLLQGRELLGSGVCQTRELWAARVAPAGRIVVEQVRNYGQQVGASVFDTVFASGRIAQHFAAQACQVYAVPRRIVKSRLAHTVKANDATIRAALIDRYGGEAAAIGGKKCRACAGSKVRQRDCSACGGSGYISPPGPLHGVHSHAWAALALGFAFLDLCSESPAGAAELAVSW